MKRIWSDHNSNVLVKMMKKYGAAVAKQGKTDQGNKSTIVYSVCGGSFQNKRGVERINKSVLREFHMDRLIDVNVESHELLSVNGDVSGIERNQVLDLSDEGDRWEGDVLHDEPYGWGVLYDKEGEKAYEGFRIGNVCVCYGTQFYADIQKVEYEGEICEGKRWGRGIQYDRNGVVVFDGEWMNDDHAFEKRVVMNDGTQFLHNRIEELIVSDKSCNGGEWSVLDLTCIPHLRLLEVGDKCFKNVEMVELIGLCELERIEIGYSSFRKCKNDRHIGSNTNGRFYLKDCERLKELKIGSYSFSEFAVCEIENLASLEVIKMDGGNFYTASLELKSTGDGMN